MKKILRELGLHLPFSAIGTVIGVMAVWATQTVVVTGTDPLWAFHPLHAAHVLLSAAATTAIFRGRGGTKVRAVIVGVIGALGICALSDAVLPYWSSLLLGATAPIHICLLEEPLLVLLSCAWGIAVGLAAANVTNLAGIASHALHVAVSAAASAWYISAAVGDEWLGVSTFLFVLVSVVLPCCLSDIVFPMCVPCRVCRVIKPCSRHYHPK